MCKSASIAMLGASKLSCSPLLSIPGYSRLSPSIHHCRVCPESTDHISIRMMKLGYTNTLEVKMLQLRSEKGNDK
ncbi:hypothetical protein SADUNF_Sadunf08G0098300 [Salix dunnii]|uniref:Uncharacterized protein n=1 Tax=Salix dunnii TaxID=1413687 RepID=A0A835MSL4_9ROSI|nr:hypothetical protein SADUNF_Sadunf08G0098300 [Salix dunnii]